jgi:hypothetical protein
MTDCLNTLQDEAFGARTPTYSAIMRLDRVLRSFAIPRAYQFAPDSVEAREERERQPHMNTPAFAMERATALLIREVCEWTRRLLGSRVPVLIVVSQACCTCIVRGLLSGGDDEADSWIRSGSFFVRTLTEFSEDPMSSPYSSSYIACYRR